MKTVPNTMQHAPLILATMTLILMPQAAMSMRIDGDFSDWDNIKPLAQDLKGDAIGAFDITRVHVTNQDTTLYLRFDTGSVVNIQNGPDSEGTLLIFLALPNNKQLILDTRGRQAHVADDVDTRIPWRHLGYVVGPTYAQDEFEMQIDLSRLGVRLGDPVAIQFGGSDSLDRPVVYTMSHPDQRPAHRSSLRFVGTDVRIVSFNTYVGGLSDPNRAPSMKRLFNAVNGDIYCFQEEWDTTETEAIMSSLVPLETDRAWHVHKVHGNIIASKYPLKALPSTLNNYAAACVDLGGRPLVVMSVHLSAMGYIQSKEDVWRVKQAKAIVETLEGIRQGAYDDCIPRDTEPGIVVVGDFNLVGSRTPVDLMVMKSPTVGLKEWVVANLVGESVTTWRGGLNASFSPGKLDYMLYSEKQLTPGNGFLLDSGLLLQIDLNRLGLLADDSTISDHLLATVDFQLRY